MRPPSSFWLAMRSLLWTVLLPGFFTAFVPWRFFGLARIRFDTSSPVVLSGVPCVAVGVALLAACILEFARSGRGTLSPVDPPRRLVVGGLYQYVRNPMYLSVTLIILGEALIAKSRAIAVYLAFWFSGANLFVMAYEEPALSQRFGASYEQYRRRVGRWIPRFRPDARSGR